MVTSNLNSCKDDSGKDEPQVTPTPVTPDGEPNGNQVLLSADQQKKKLESVASDLIDVVDQDQLKYYSKLKTHLDENYDHDPVAKWLDEAIESMTSFEGKNTQKEDPYGESDSWWYYSVVDAYHCSNYKGIYVLSNFLGHFTETNGTWKYEKANDLQFNFKDQTGKQCNVTVTTSGKSKKAYLDKDVYFLNSELVNEEVIDSIVYYDKWDDKYISYYDYRYHYEEYYDITERYLYTRDYQSHIYTEWRFT